MNKKKNNHFLNIQLKIIKELFKEYKIETMVIILFSCCPFVTTFVEVKFIQYSTNEVANFLTAAGTVQVTVWKTFFTFLAILFVLTILTCIYYCMLTPYVSKIQLRSEEKLIRKLAYIPYEYYENSYFYERINMAKQAGAQYSDAVFGISEIVHILLMLVIYTRLLLQINPVFITIILLSIIINSILAGYVTDKQLKFWEKNVSPVTRRNNYFKNIINGRVNHQNIQNAGNLSYFIKKHHDYNQKEGVNYLKLNLLSIVTDLFSSFLFLVVFAVVIVYLGKGVVNKEYSLGYFTMVIALLMDMFSTIKKFTLFVLNGNRYAKILDAYYDILDIENEMVSNVITSLQTNMLLRFEHLKYQYPQAKTYALKDISAKFFAGEKVAVVGANGSGKSTFINIILSVLNNYEGEVQIAEINCAAILQDYAKYQLTVKENIEMGNGGKLLSEEEIVEILKETGLYEFVSKLKEGIYTKLGQFDGGVELSVGQWQRLVIGRLLANKKANVWVLDEPTAHLDPISEIDIYKFILELSGEKLVFFISHRLGFAIYADKIVVIDDGRIVEMGTHNELMAQANGIYRHMFNLQKNWYKE